MKKFGNWLNRFRFLTAVVFVSVPSLFAQYSNETLKGPWLVRDTAFDLVSVNNLGYVVFDGTSSVADMSSFGMGCSGFLGNYTVEPSDTSFSLNLYQSDCNSLALTGQFLSYSSATYMSGAKIMWRVSNPGALTDSLVGTLNSPACGQKNIVLCLDSEGVVTSCTGIGDPVFGSIYADSGLFVGHFITGDTSTCPGGSMGWNEFAIAGTYSNDSLTGIVYFGDSDTNSGTVLLVRKGTVTSVIKKGSAVETQQIACRAVRGGMLFITLKNPVHGNVQMQVMDLLGRTAAFKVVHFASGSHAAQVDLSRLSRGAYIVRLQAGGFAAQKRIAIE